MDFAQAKANLGLHTVAAAGVQKLISENIDGTMTSVHNWLGNTTNLETAICLVLFRATQRVMDTMELRPYGGIVDQDLYGVNYTRPDDVHAVDNAENKAFLKMMAQADASSLAYFVDLMMAHQVRRLTDRNVHGYFMQFQGTDIDGSKVIKVLDAFAGMVPKIIRDDDIRARIEESIWLGYHTNGSSTPALCVKVRSETGDIWGRLANQDENRAIDAAHANMWDVTLSRAISPRIIVIVGAYLRANGSLPDNWYQFASARAATSTVVYNTALAFFTKRAALAGSVARLETATTIIGLNEMIPAALQAPAAEAGADGAPAAEGVNHA